MQKTTSQGQTQNKRAKIPSSQKIATRAIIMQRAVFCNLRNQGLLKFKNQILIDFPN
jgi:hypothetical protein